MEQQFLMKNQLNIDLPSDSGTKGIPHYYLMIPFAETLTTGEFSSHLYRRE